MHLSNPSVWIIVSLLILDTPLIIIRCYHELNVNLNLLGTGLSPLSLVGVHLQAVHWIQETAF